MEPNVFRTGVSTKLRDHGSQQSPPRETPASSMTLDTELRGSVVMELMVDKLKLLNYERRFCNSRSPPWPRLHKFYFALPSPNRNEQFLYFSSMVAWLFGFLGCQFAPPSEVDDPNVTCTKIMMEFMRLGFVTPNWPPARLKQGYGDAVCSVLDTLCSLALDAINFKFTPVTPSHCEESFQAAPDDTGHNENSSELYAEDEHNTLETYDDNDIPRIIVDLPLSNDTNTTNCMTTDKWKLDLERIAPHLRISVVADGNDWRTHLDQARKLYEDSSSCFNNGETHFKRFQENVTSSLEKLESHENFINQQFESLISEYVAVKGRLVGAQEKHKQIVEMTSKLTSEHEKLLESLEEIKQKMINKGNEISDLSPLLQMKSAMQKLKVELRDMEVQIGVLEHSLVHVSVRQAKGRIDDAKG